jgi:hypothetical protein
MITSIQSLKIFNKYWYNTIDGRKETYIVGDKNKYFDVKNPQEWVYMLE